MRQVLFMDEGERAEGGISEEHQVPVRTPPAVAALSQAGWEVPARWAYRSLLRPGLPCPPGLPVGVCRMLRAKTAVCKLGADFSSLVVGKSSQSIPALKSH